MKRAVLEEQSKSSVLREALRTKETALRRAEQEVDSIGFRNKQLEHRVASLQDDFNKENSKKAPKTSNKTKSKTNTNTDRDSTEQSLVFNEELQKKILESAELASMVDDKSMEIRMQKARIEELERALHKLNFEQAEKDATIRKEMERVVARNHDLEAKLADAGSVVSSDDTIYVMECEQHQQILNNNHNANSNGSNTSSLDTNEDRILALEKELIFWRTQYELLKISTKAHEEIDRKSDNEKCIENDEKTAKTDETKDPPLSTEQLINKHFGAKMEDLFMKKSMAESKLAVYVEEVWRDSSCFLFEGRD